MRVARAAEPHVTLRVRSLCLDLRKGLAGAFERRVHLDTRRLRGVVRGQRYHSICIEQ